MSKSLIDECKRCLQCKYPRCSKGCPVNTPIKEMIAMLKEGELLEAGEMLFNNNPLSVVCSLVCPHDKQCEGNCVLGIKGSPIDVSEIEHYISNYYLNFIKTSSEKIPGKKVAIIGSGPAGITIAFILAARGYDITIFEANDKIGGVMRYGIPEFRLPKSLLERLKDKLLESGIKIRPNILIGQVLTLDDLFRDGYKAAFIGTGTWKPRTLGIKGESLGNVHYAIDYLKNPDVYKLGNTLCIIGAGNVAMDVARTALRLGVSNVHVLTRGNESSITAEKHEVEYALLDGVKFEFYKSPVEITEEGVLCADTTTTTDEDGNLTFNIVEGEPELFPADSVIVAISQGPRNNIVTTSKDIKITRDGLVAVDETGRTTRPGVFASGDVVTGAKTVVEAVKVSKRVADAIDEYVLSTMR